MVTKSRRAFLWSCLLTRWLSANDVIVLWFTILQSMLKSKLQVLLLLTYRLNRELLPCENLVGRHCLSRTGLSIHSFGPTLTPRSKVNNALFLNGFNTFLTLLTLVLMTIGNFLDSI
jgi:hypothetical protein